MAKGFCVLSLLGVSLRTYWGRSNSQTLCLPDAESQDSGLLPGPEPWVLEQVTGPGWPAAHDRKTVTSVQKVLLF